MKKSTINMLKEKAKIQYGVLPAKNQLRRLKKWYLCEGRFLK